MRLGHGGGDMKEMSPDAIDRGIACLRRMRRIADSFDATLRAVATSAVREAVNAARSSTGHADEAGVEIEVISGAEEARLIHLGVLQAVPVFEQRMLLVDIGGGSTELLIGERGETLAARSFKLGAVRLTDRFFPGGRVDPKAIAPFRQYVRGVLSHFQRDVDGTASTSPWPRRGRPRRSPAWPTPRRGPSRCARTTATSSRRRSWPASSPSWSRRRTASARAKVPGLEAGPRRHRPRRRADPGDGGDDVRRRADHVQRGRAA